MDERRQARWIAALVVLALALTAVVLWLYGGRSTGEPSQPPVLTPVLFSRVQPELPTPPVDEERPLPLVATAAAAGLAALLPEARAGAEAPGDQAAPEVPPAPAGSAAAASAADAGAPVVVPTLKLTVLDGTGLCGEWALENLRSRQWQMARGTPLDGALVWYEDDSERALRAATEAAGQSGSKPISLAQIAEERSRWQELQRLEAEQRAARATGALQPPELLVLGRELQEPARFLPDVVVVRPGQELAVQNDLGRVVLHAVNADEQQVALLTIAPQRQGSFRFAMPTTTPYRVHLLSEPEVFASVHVLPQPFDWTNSQGCVRFQDVACGSFRVYVWHRSAGTRSAFVTVGAGPGEAELLIAYR